jgi:hypothetical protein
MAYAPIKLGRVYIKQQSAWGTAETSFVDADSIDLQGVFIPSPTEEALGQPTQRPQFGASAKVAGSRAGGTVQCTWVMTNFSGTTSTNEQQLIADALGVLQTMAGIGTITGASTATQLAMATSSTSWNGQGFLVGLSGGGSEITWVKEDASPTAVNITEISDLPDDAVSVGPTITVAFNEDNLANLPFTLQSVSSGANASFRTWDARVSSLTITSNSKGQLLIAATLTTLNWAPLDAVTATKFSFPRTQLGPNINANSFNEDNDTSFCYASLSISVTNTLAMAECNGSAQGVSQLITVDRSVVITERQLSEDLYADAYEAPGTASSKIYGLTSKGSATGSHAAIYAPMMQLQKTSVPTDLGGIWGVERVYEIRNSLNTGDSSIGSSTVKQTNFRISFG